MMPRFIEYELEDGGTLYVEAPEAERPSGLVSDPAVVGYLLAAALAARK
jgi:hypothetical protein